MRRLVAFDPGKTTGVSLWQYDSETPLTHVGHGQIEGGLDGFLEYFYPKGMFLPWDVIVSESFVLDGRTPNPDVTPLKIEGALESHAHRTGALLRLQRNNFKAHVPDSKLKELGFYVKGMPHANDSMRHALAFMKTSYHAPTLNAYFKVEEG